MWCAARQVLKEEQRKLWRCLHWMEKRTITHQTLFSIREHPGMLFAVVGGYSWPTASRSQRAQFWHKHCKGGMFFSLTGIPRHILFIYLFIFFKCNCNSLLLNNFEVFQIIGEGEGVFGLEIFGCSWTSLLHFFSSRFKPYVTRLGNVWFCNYQFLLPVESNQGDTLPTKNLFQSFMVV